MGSNCFLVVSENEAPSNVHQFFGILVELS